MRNLPKRPEMSDFNPLNTPEMPPGGRNSAFVFAPYAPINHNAAVSPMCIVIPDQPAQDTPFREADTADKPLIMALLADDDAINRQIVEHILTESRGFELVIAEDGRKALQACLTQRFDLLIVDFKMPGISGDRLIRHLRSSLNPNRSTPAILFSASTRQELGPVVDICGADDVITKPINSKEFLSSVKDVLAEKCAA